MFRKIKMEDAITDTQTKGILTLIVSEMQEIVTKAQDKYVTKEDCLIWMQDLLDAWVKPNKLHPERVKTIPEELTNRIQKGDRKVWKEVFEWYSKEEWLK